MPWLFEIWYCHAYVFTVLAMENESWPGHDTKLAELKAVVIVLETPLFLYSFGWILLCFDWLMDRLLPVVYVYGLDLET